MSLLQNSNAISSGGYDINNSLRFRRSASSYLSRTPASAGNRQIMTYSFWTKRGFVGSPTSDDYCPISAYTDASNLAVFYFNSSNGQSFDVFFKVGATNYAITTTQVFRDPSAWYHIVVAIDTTQATASNRTKIYINGLQVTSFLSASYVPQNSNLATNNNVAQYFGTQYTSSSYYDGYLAEVNFIDGQALTPSSFGETDAVTGQWVAKKYTGTYGTNGFYLPFTTSTTTAYAGSFNGSTQYLTTPTSSNFNISTSNFTVEAWVYSTSNSRNVVLNLGPQNTGASSAITMQIEQTSQSYIAYMGDGSTYYTITGGQVGQLNNWVHVALVRSSGVVKLYINGVAGSAVTVSGSPSNSKSWCVGGFLGPAFSYGWTGYISNFRFVNGTAVYTSNFIPPTSALTAITNTQLLTCQNSTAIDNSTNAFTITNNGTTTFGAGNVIFNANIAVDTSGNANNWTPNNINYSIYGTTYDAMTDSPTLTSATVANYCTANPLDSFSTSVISNANLTVNVSGSATGSGGCARCNTINFTNISGKWYWEMFVDNAGTGAATLRLTPTMILEPVNVSSNPSGFTWYWRADGLTNLTGAGTFATNDILMFAYDSDTGKLWAGKNGTWVNSGVPSSGTGQAYTLTALASYALVLNYGTSGGGTGTASFNYGQRPFSYTPPTGFKRLNTFNLPDSTIKKGSKYMDATLYTGDGTTSRTITNASGFRPDMVWNKCRSSAENHAIEDSVRGLGLWLSPNQTIAEQSWSNVGPTTNGFIVSNVGSSPNKIWNDSGLTYVGWQWQAGQGSTSSNTSGTITSTVSVNATAGFSIVTYTGTGANATVGHGLGVAPKMVIVKSRSTAGTDWPVYHASLGATGIVALDATIAFTVISTPWNNTAPTSSVFTVGTSGDTNVSSRTYVAYCWAAIAGYSAFGSYTGNGSTDGPMIYTGFQPKYVLVKRTDSAGYSWIVLDSVRSPYNVASARLIPNTSDAESSGTHFEDFLSNGFKLRGTSLETNASGGTYIYACWASNPFKNSNAF